MGGLLTIVVVVFFIVAFAKVNGKTTDKSFADLKDLKLGQVARPLFYFVVLVFFVFPMIVFMLGLWLL